MKKVLSVVLSALLVAALFAGCSANKDEKYSDTTLIIGYTASAAPFLEANEDGTATGFIPDVWEAIFNDVKGDLKSYRFEQVEEGYALEDDGGFYDSENKEYSAGLLMGAVSKNSGTFNEDYSFTEPLITNRVIAVTAKDGAVKSYKDLAGATVITVSDAAKTALEKNAAVYNALASVSEAATADEALSALDAGTADAVIIDEFTFCPSEKAEAYTVLDGELDTIEYVIACAKYSGWKDSINNAIYELKSPDYNDSDDFTPLVEQYFGYNASSFDFQPKQTK